MEIENNISKYHFFNVYLAEKYGLHEAIIINHLAFWIEKNIANKKNFVDGHYWTYNSIKAFQKIIPYLSEKQIRFSLKNLEKKGIIKIGNYNQFKYDRTQWYTIIDDDIKKIYNLYDSSILQNGNLHLSILSNGNVQNVKPIPYIKPDIISNINNICNSIKEDSKKDTKNTSSLAEDCYEIMNYFNKVCNTNFRHNENNYKLIRKLLKDNFSVEDIKKVIYSKYIEWKDDPKMKQYIRPITIFSNKFESYLQFINKSKTCSENNFF